MSDREQWRFQWPDGTWIRWNPQTQSWEKEDQGGSAVSEPGPSTPSSEIPRPTAPPAEPSAPTGSSGRQPVADQASAPTSPPVQEEGTRPQGLTPFVASPEAEASPVPETRPEVRGPSEPRPQPTPAPETRPRTPRSSARDVLPPQQEPDRPGGSLLPTVVAGAVVGLGVGLLLSALIR